MLEPEFPDIQILEFKFPDIQIPKFDFSDVESSISTIIMIIVINIVVIITSYCLITVCARCCFGANGIDEERCAATCQSAGTTSVPGRSLAVRVLLMVVIVVFITCLIIFFINSKWIAIQYVSLVLYLKIQYPKFLDHFITSNMRQNFFRIIITFCKRQGAKFDEY